jgi:hypothetical protein
VPSSFDARCILGQSDEGRRFSKDHKKDPMPDDVQYSVRDSYGNIYGPAPAALLRQWVGEGRIVPGMLISAAGDSTWVEVSAHPAVADLFSRAAGSSMLGAPQQVTVERMDYARPGRTSGTAVASLVLGIVSLIGSLPSCGLVCCCVGAGPFALAGLFLGFLALGEMRSTLNDLRGRGMAIAGIVLSSVALLIMALAVLGFYFWGTWATHFHGF